MRRAVRGFAAVETWVFDLDNTLYPHHVNLWQQVDVRIRDYIANFLKLTHDEAFRLQKDLLSALRHQSARPDGGARALIPTNFSKWFTTSTIRRSRPTPRSARRSGNCPGRKLILTNGTRAHAEAVMARLGIRAGFEDIFDIAAAELEPKPRAVVYDRFCRAP